LKFKYLIAIFSIIIIIAVFISVFLPRLLVWPQNAMDFRYLTLPLLVLMVLLLGGLGIFFLSNYRLLNLLEREDWPALSHYLEQKTIIKGRYNNRRVKLLASTYLVMSDFLSVLKLENKIMLAKPSIVEKNVLVFGAARVLSGNHKEIEKWRTEKALETTKFKRPDLLGGDDV